MVGGGLKRLSRATMALRFAQLIVIRAVSLLIHVQTHDRAVVGDQCQRTHDTSDHNAAAHQAASSSGMWLIGCSPVAQRYCTAYERHGRQRCE